jgi:hypothetical protein
MEQRNPEQRVPEKLIPGPPDPEQVAPEQTAVERPPFEMVSRDSSRQHGTDSPSDDEDSLPETSESSDPGSPMELDSPDLYMENPKQRRLENGYKVTIKP